MDKIQRKTIIVVTPILLLASSFVLYTTFIQGNNFGPSFIEDLKTDAVPINNVVSIEIIEPAVGHTPFDEKEYIELHRRNTIFDKHEIKTFLHLLKAYSIKGRIHMNHPGSVYKSYMKINLSNNEFYYLYINILKDSSSVVYEIDANSKNSTNPNGASIYHNKKIKKFILKYDFENLRRPI